VACTWAFVALLIIGASGWSICRILAFSQCSILNSYARCISAQRGCLRESTLDVWKYTRFLWSHWIKILYFAPSRWCLHCFIEATIASNARSYVSYSCSAGLHFREWNEVSRRTPQPLNLLRILAIANPLASVWRVIGFSRSKCCKMGASVNAP
jgi:hypothetical protein